MVYGFIRNLDAIPTHCGVRICITTRATVMVYRLWNPPLRRPANLTTKADTTVLRQSRFWMYNSFLEKGRLLRDKRLQKEY